MFPLFTLSCFNADLIAYESTLCNPLNAGLWEYLSMKEIQEKLLSFLKTLSNKDRFLFIDAAIRGYPYKTLAKSIKYPNKISGLKFFECVLDCVHFFEME